MSESKGSSRRSSGPRSGGSSSSARRAPGVRRKDGADAPKGSSRTARRAAGAGAAGAAAKGTSKKAAGAGSANFMNYPRAGKGPIARWLPSWRLLAAAFALVVIAGVAFSVWLYNSVDIPEEPTDIAVAQTTRVYFADGETSMGQFSQINRTIVGSDKIPDTVREAAVASEDSTFYENRGISPRGIMRAMINNLQGGARQGGSTITQQYVERYLTGTETSYWGKLQEMVMALKLDQEMSKEEILSGYLNTIYFGRGAYGIEEAAQAYFGKPASELSESEAALLVAVIPAPSAYDPAVDPEKAQELWARVIERQVNETGTMTAAEADALQFPETIDPPNEDTLAGTNGYLLRFIKDELIAQGYTEEQIDTGGFTIISTIDPAVQDDTVQAVNELPEGRPENNHVGTVTMDPSTGAIRGMYGGRDYITQSRNDASQSRMMAGSIYKTFTLVAALRQEEPYGLYSRWNGNSPAQFQGWRVKNFGDRSYGTVTLKEATARSINTAYAELNIEMGPEETTQAAIDLGLSENTPGLDNEAPNVLGTASPTAVEMAEAYSTLASGGIHRNAYMVQQVLNSDGSTEYEHQDDGERVLDDSVAANATSALEGPPSTGGTASEVKRELGRPVAGKTGTSERMRSAWFVGFTPQYVTAVGMFQPTADGRGEESLTPWAGVDNVTGSTFPVDIWLGIMVPAHEGLDTLEFPPEQNSGSRRPGGTNPQPAQTQEPTRTQGPTRTQEPTQTQEPAQTQEPTQEPPPSEEPTTQEPPPSEEPPPSQEPPPSEEAPPSQEPPPSPEPPPTEAPPSQSPGGRGGPQQPPDDGATQPTEPPRGQGGDGDTNGGRAPDPTRPPRGPNG